MNEFDFGWLVGILEGEGTFVCSQDKRRPHTYTVKIQVEMTDKDSIDRINQLVPGKVWESVYPSRTKIFKNVKRSWRWAISRKDQCKELAEKVYPYMSQRRKEQIEKCLPHCEYIRKPK